MNGIWGDFRERLVTESLPNHTRWKYQGSPGLLAFASSQTMSLSTVPPICLLRTHKLPIRKAVVDEDAAVRFRASVQPSQAGFATVDQGSWKCDRMRRMSEKGCTVNKSGHRQCDPL